MPLSIQQHASVLVMPMLMVLKATSGLLVSAIQLSRLLSGWSVTSPGVMVSY